MPSFRPLPRRAALVALAAAATLHAGHGHAQDALPDAFATLAADPRFATWLKLIQAAGLSRETMSGRAFTMFAPTEAAFDRYPEVRRTLLAAAESRGAGMDRVMRFVQTHVVDGKRDPNDFQFSQQSRAGTPVTVESSGLGTLRVTWASDGDRTGSAVVVSPIEASNGVIYPIDDVMLSR